MGNEPSLDCCWFHYVVSRTNSKKTGCYTSFQSYNSFCCCRRTCRNDWDWRWHIPLPYSALNQMEGFEIHCHIVFHFNSNQFNHKLDDYLLLLQSRCFQLRLDFAASECAWWNCGKYYWNQNTNATSDQMDNRNHFDCSWRTIYLECDCIKSQIRLDELPSILKAYC